VTDYSAAIERLRHPPRQIYSILGQAWPDLDEAGYTANLLTLHRRIRREAQRFAEALAASESWLAPAASEFRPHVDPRRYPPLDSRQYRFSFPEQGGARLLRHLPDGVKYLEALGFQPRQGGVLQETEFHFSGSPVLDFIEIVVRDLVGIDRGVHGNQIRSISGAGFMLRNRILELGARDERVGWWAVLYFEKPGSPGSIPYGIFRSALRTLLEDHLERGSFPYAGVDQRKLGLGRGAEFSLRVQLPDGPGEKLEGFLHELFHEEGALEPLRFALTLQEEIPVPAEAGESSPDASSARE
jgi:hypothetical protein